MKVNRKSKNHAPDISYFRLSLMEFLKESHPERLNDHRLTIACADAAAETYEQTIRNGGTPGCIASLPGRGINIETNGKGAVKVINR